MIKTTRTWSDFNIQEYLRNGELLNKAMQDGVKIYGMENANAYTFEPVQGVPMRGLCPIYTAVDDETTATALRQQGMTLPILVLRQPAIAETGEQVKILHGSFLAQSVASLPLVRALQGKVMLYGGVLRLHLKVEMASEGAGFHYLNDEDSIDDLVAAMSLGGTYCEGICTELLREDGPEVNDRKIDAFIKLADRLDEATGKPFAVRHYFMR